MNDPTLAIDLHDVTKVYRGRVHALQGIEMQVRRGEVFGLLGPNGAGKSTLVKIMMSVVRPTLARGTILGKPVAHKPTLSRIGYLPENHRFPRYLTGRQILEFFGAMAQVDRATRKRRAAELLDVVGMAGAADRAVATYSKGMAQRVGLGQALMNDPDLVVLDEPTDGVDPEGRRDIRDVLGRLREQGKTVFINSHLLSELELVSDRVAILVGGRVARQGSIHELSAAKQRYEIEIVPDPAAPDALRRALPASTTLTRQPPPALPASAVPAAVTPTAVAPAVPPPLPVLAGTTASGAWVEIEGPVLRVGSVDPREVQPVLDALRAAGAVVRRVQLVRPTLEELFIDTLASHAAGPVEFPAGLPAGLPAA